MGSPGVGKQSCFVSPIAIPHKTVGLSARAVRAEGLDQMTAAGVLIRLVEIDKRLHVMIDAGDGYENPTAGALHAAVPLARLWLARVRQHQHPWMGGGINMLFDRLTGLRREGKSYQELAKQLNTRLRDLIEEHLSRERQQNAVHQDSTKPRDADGFWPNRYSKVHATLLLTDLGLTDAEAREIVDEALARARDGLKPFGASGPITRQRVINFMKRFQRKIGIDDVELVAKTLRA